MSEKWGDMCCDETPEDTPENTPENKPSDEIYKASFFCTHCNKYGHTFTKNRCRFWWNHLSNSPNRIICSTCVDKNGHHDSTSETGGNCRFRCKDEDCPLFKTWHTEEHHQYITTIKQVHKSQHRKIKCFNCGDGHHIRDCPAKRPTNSPQIVDFIPDFPENSKSAKQELAPTVKKLFDEAVKREKMGRLTEVSILQKDSSIIKQHMIIPIDFDGSKQIQMANGILTMVTAVNPNGSTERMVMIIPS